MRAPREALLAGAWLTLLSCARTGLWTDEVGGGTGGEGGSVDATPVDECALDADCPSDDACTPAVCLAPDGAHEARYCATRTVTCDDGNPCTLDHCDPGNGRCVFDAPGDADHDGYRGKAGMGMPARCGGPDCDDDDPAVFPGAPERCDGKDNDCNGAIDEGELYVSSEVPVPLAPQSFRSDVGGFAFDGTDYAVTYTDFSPRSHTQSYFQTLNRDGTVASGPSLVSEINADTYAGTLSTSGKAFFTAWADARQGGDYEVYGTRFNAQSEKLEAGQRLTDAPGKSVSPVTAFIEDGYRITWVDHRFDDSEGVTALFGRKVTADGQADGDELRLTTSDEDGDFPDMAASESRVAVTYVVDGAYSPEFGEVLSSVRVRSFDADFNDASAPVELGTDAQNPSIVRTAQGFVVAWQTGSTMPRGWGPALWGAVVDERGGLITTSAITSGDFRAKSRALVSLGDRVLVVWSAMPTETSRYQLYYEIISALDLHVMTPRQLLVTTQNDLESPIARLGPSGDVGIVFADSTAKQAYFMRLACAVGFPAR
ncbi:MAG TPA: putative metal-binding motif-containing protein [Polyangiaceae bacterium]|nr:putative metal-binding motif-containing protein [Polyangiaceae bacterium]